MALLDELKSRYTIDLYHDAAYLPHIGLQSADFGCFDYRLFERNAVLLDYHALIYHVASSPYHVYIHDILRRYPGIVTLHDLGTRKLRLKAREGPNRAFALVCR